MAAPDLTGYVTVAERIDRFREKYPEGCLRPVDPSRPFEVREIGGKVFLVYAAAAYRDREDALPGIGVAWEPFPGTTPYTRNSELMNCFSEDTEVLTTRGWMRFSVLPGNIRVASARMDGTWRFDFPTAYIKSETRQLITVEDNLTRQVVTPDHRVLVGGDFIEARHLDDRRIRGTIPHSGILVDRLGSLNIASEDYARLLQWVIADGCYPKGNCEPIVFGFTKTRKIERLTALLDRMSITYWHGITGQGRHDFRLGAKDEIVKAVRADVPDKTLTGEIALKFSHSQAIAFIEEAVHTDGTPGTRGGIYVRSTDRGYVESLCLLGAAHGYDATSLAFNDPPGAFPNGKPTHRVRLKKKTRRMTRKISVENFDEPVPVYCVTMPLGTVVIRNNGKIAVSGQCETSAWGRAIIAVLAADTISGIASADEVRNRQEERQDAPRRPPATRGPAYKDAQELIEHAAKAETPEQVRADYKAAASAGWLREEIAHPETGEKLSAEAFLTARGNDLKHKSSRPAAAEDVPGGNGGEG
jgi:hypothetical protein